MTEKKGKDDGFDQIRFVCWMCCAIGCIFVSLPIYVALLVMGVNMLVLLVVLGCIAGGSVFAFVSLSLVMYSANKTAIKIWRQDKGEINNE